jgi:5-methyltetrahydrofolate--homocysteine methyltransferase
MGGGKMIDQEKFHTLISQGKTEEVKRLTQETLERGEPVENILKNGLIQAMERIGVRFKSGEIYIPEVLIAARAMHAGLAVLNPSSPSPQAP